MKVFVSCGQHTSEERQIAQGICTILRRRGFQPYLAIAVQTILDINNGIIGALKDSDAYLLVNFRRELLSDGTFRGSLFSHQEFGIAYALGFDKVLVVNQAKVRREGMLAYVGSNTEEFTSYEDCLEVVERALEAATWATEYSRRLRADGLRLEEQIITYGPLCGRFLYVDVHNHRPDIAALEATARLANYAQNGGQPRPSVIRSPLKATARPGFAHTIFPNSHEAFDMLCVGESVDQPGVERLYLNSALDRRPTEALPLSHGLCELEYEVFAIGFPLLTVKIELTWPRHGPILSRLTRQPEPGCSS